MAMRVGSDSQVYRPVFDGSVGNIHAECAPYAIRHFFFPALIVMLLIPFTGRTPFKMAVGLLTQIPQTYL
jgi:hypothetical protein